MCKIRKSMTIYLSYLCSIVRCMRTLPALLLLLITSAAFAQPSKISTEQYVIKYKDFAIEEMYRTGVPASITLAQGILESQNGNSRLAREANNHFGIKCKTGWTGKTIIANDDTEGECFRAYESALESYKDHSNFLRENWRYSECFKLERTDYAGWAEGLRKAGYATNPKYNTLITGIIDRYMLHQYDLAPMPEGVKPEYEMKNNDLPVVFAQEGETIEVIAQKNDIKPNQIYRYNDLPKGTQIEPGDIVYLKPKRRKGSEPFHVVHEGENMHDLSQLYGIKLKQLYKKNHVEPGKEVVPGTTLYLQKKRSDKPATMSKEEFERLEKEKNKPAPEEVVSNEIVKKEITIPHEEIAEPSPVIEKYVADEKVENAEYHIIKSGDNLYRISEKYHVFVEDLLEWNGIASPDQIAKGDKIYLSKDAATKAGLIKAAVPKKENTVAKKEVKKPVVVKSKTHLVSRGDTAYKICRTYGINTAQLMEWNGLKNIDSIREGQKLKVGE